MAIKEDNCRIVPKEHEEMENLELPGKTNLDLQIHFREESSQCDAISLASLMLGRWQTLLHRSNALEPLLKSFGIAFYKRVIVDNCAIKLDVNLINYNLEITLHLPLGKRFLLWRVDGGISVENDPDCGIWKGYCQLVRHQVKGLEHYGSVSMLQQVRTHEKIGIVHETRGVLPDSEHGKILYFKYKLFPKMDPEQTVEVVRILKPLPH